MARQLEDGVGKLLDDIISDWGDEESPKSLVRAFFSVLMTDAEEEEMLEPFRDPDGLPEHFCGDIVWESHPEVALLDRPPEDDRAEMLKYLGRNQRNPAVIEDQAERRRNRLRKRADAARKRRADPTYRYHRLVADQARTGKPVSLTLEQALALYEGPCHYCGAPGPGGIDRVDNLEGYTAENSVSCCQPCNYMKGTLTVDDWMSRMKRILARRG